MSVGRRRRRRRRRREGGCRDCGLGAVCRMMEKEEGGGRGERGGSGGEMSLRDA
jgi:hypothetical protein